VHVAKALAENVNVGNKKAIRALGACIADSDELVSTCASEVFAKTMLTCSPDVAEMTIPLVRDHLGEQPLAPSTNPSQFAMRIMMALASQNARLVLDGGDDSCAPFVERIRITSLCGILGGFMQIDEGRLSETQSQTFLAALSLAITNDSSNLSAITPSEIGEIMLKILRNVVLEHNEQFTPVSLSIVCYAIGFLGDTMSESQEQTMIVAFTRFMLDTVSACGGPERYTTRVTLVSGLQHMLTQHPRFLKRHRKFMTTTVEKLHEFMLEDRRSGFDMVTLSSMAVYYFNKIAVTCTRKLAKTEKDGQSFIENLIVRFPGSALKLDANCRQLYIKSLRCVAKKTTSEHRGRLLTMLQEKSENVNG
jgi:hypothetical protein